MIPISSAKIVRQRGASKASGIAPRQVSMRTTALFALTFLLLFSSSATALEPLHQFREKPRTTLLFRDATRGPASSLPDVDPTDWSQSLRRLTHRKRGAEALTVGAFLMKFGSQTQNTGAALDAQDLAKLIAVDGAMAVPLGAPNQRLEPARPALR